MGWIQIVFARLVDDPEIPSALRFRVRNGNVNFTALEGDLVASVIEADK
jgi:hypothetical protein